MKRTNKMYRLLALMLSVLMLFACMPLSAVAADTDLVSVNLFTTEHLEAKYSGIFYAWNNGEAYDSDAGNFDQTDRLIQSGALDASVDGDTTTTKDIWGYDYTDVTNNQNLVVARYHLDNVYYCENIVLYAGDTSKDAYFRIYASTTLDNLYSNPSNTVSTATICNGSAVTVELNRDVKYIAVVYDAYATIANYPEEVEDKNSIKDTRIAEFQLFGLAEPVEDTDDPVVPPSEDEGENLFVTDHLEYMTGGIFYAWAQAEVVDDKTGTFYTDTRIDGAGALTGSVDDDTTNSKDIWAYDYTDVTANQNLLVARYHLDDVYYCSKLVLYAGDTSKDAYFRVYASTTLGSLYSASNTISTATICNDSAVTVELNRDVQYISVVYDAYATVANYPVDDVEFNSIKDSRIAEIQLFGTAKESENPDFVSENLFQTDLADSKTIAMYVNTGNLHEESTSFDQNGALAGSVDNNTTATYAVYDALEYEYPLYFGALYTLNGNNYADNLKIYAGGADGANAKVKVYAGDALDTLYAEYNCVAEELEVTKDGTEINLDKYVKYVAIFCIGYVDVAEFQLWSGDPAGAVAPDDTTLRVLTLGNSFSENTSRYVTDIAYANGLELTFGYLKYPSCSIPQYLEAANNDWSLFKFEVVAPDGTRQTIKTEAGSFNAGASNATTCASIAEALEFTDWDVVVFQMDSFNSLDGANFNALPALIEYVKGIEPNAKLMLHEVWAWGVWENDPDKNFTKIKANNEAAAIASDIAIIPSGLAFENARDELGSYTILNDNDGYYQHANNYGCYVAGAAYVASLIGSVNVDTFDGHVQVDDQGFVQTLNAAANAAVKYYNSYGDANNSGEVENTDLASLRKYLIGAGTVETTLADANYNGQIDITDLIRVKKHLAGVEVVLGPSK